MQSLPSSLYKFLPYSSSILPLYRRKLYDAGGMSFRPASSTMRASGRPGSSCGGGDATAGRVNAVVGCVMMLVWGVVCMMKYFTLGEIGRLTNQSTERLHQRCTKEPEQRFCARVHVCIMCAVQHLQQVGIFTRNQQLQQSNSVQRTCCKRRTALISPMSAPYTPSILQWTPMCDLPKSTLALT